MRKHVLSVGLLLLVLGLAGCPSTKVIVPPITETAARIDLPGKFVWFDLFSTDMTTSSNFYEALFGWRIERTNSDVARVKTIHYRGRAIANLIGREADSGKARWLPYMSVKDVDSSLRQAEDLGGTIYKPAKELPNRGRIGIALDPQQAVFAMVASSIGDPVDDKPEANRWLGSELWTTDADGAGEFYSKLAGYTVKLVEVHKKVQYRVLTSQGCRRGGIVSLPWRHATPEWIPYIGVNDVLGTTIKAQKLGGKLLLAPDMSVKQGRVAIIEDPVGAVFGIQQVK